MADDKVEVELVAKTEGLNSGLEAGLEKINTTLEAIRESLERVDEKAKETEGILQKMLSMETFDFIKEHATEAFNKINEGFEATIGKAEEFSLSNAKFAAMMGTSETEAAGLAAALRGVGSSAEQYEGMALKLEMRLKSSEPAMREMGIATRDSSGHLLSGKELMDSAISTMQTYKSGTDQNSFALEVFGRRAADVYDIMRVSAEDVEHQIDIYREFGVEMEGTGGQAQEFESSLNDLKTMFDALTIKIGQELMPAAQVTLKWIGTDGKDFLVDMAKKVEEAASAVMKLVVALATVVGWLEKSADWIEKTDQKLDGTFGTLRKLNNELGNAILGNGFVDTREHAGLASVAVDGLSTSFDRLKASIEAALAPAKETFKMYDSEGVPINLQRPAENPYIKDGGTKSFKAPGKKGPKDNSADEEINSEKAIALEKISIEEATNQHLLAMGAESVEQ